MLAPIILFVYNRPDHTRQTVQALLRNRLASESFLFVFADGPKSNISDEGKKKIVELRKYIHTITGFKNIVIEESSLNKGLANSIIYGVTKIIKKYGKAVIIEDDVVTSSHFLDYINQSLDIYEKEDDVICINGASYFNEANIKENTFFQYGADCQGWATWERAWDLFNPNGKELYDEISTKRDLIKILTYDSSYDYMNMLKGQYEGKIDSWAIRWLVGAVLDKKLCLYPTKSLVHNIGFDCEGTNTKGSGSDYENYYIGINADETTLNFPRIPIRDNKRMRIILEKLFKRLYHIPTKRQIILSKIKNAVKNLIKR